MPTLPKEAKPRRPSLPANRLVVRAAPAALNAKQSHQPSIYQHRTHENSPRPLDSQSSRNPCPCAASLPPGLSAARIRPDLRARAARAACASTRPGSEKRKLSAFAKRRNVGNCPKLLPEPFTTTSRLPRNAFWRSSTETTCSKCKSSASQCRLGFETHFKYPAVRDALHQTAEMLKRCLK